MAFTIKAEVRDLRATTFVFAAQKTIYGGKHIAKGDTVFVFASENKGARPHCAWRGHPPKQSRRNAVSPGKRLG
jgi:hypothetical protein